MMGWSEVSYTCIVTPLGSYLPLSKKKDYLLLAISFSFLRIAQKLLARYMAAPANDFSFLIKSRTFTFSLQGSTLQFPLGIVELRASLLLHFGAIIRWNKRYLNTSVVDLMTKGTVSDWWVGYAGGRDGPHQGWSRARWHEISSCHSEQHPI